MITRKPDWELSLIDYLDQAALKPFSWGNLDCCLFAANAVNAMTGHDYAKDFRGKYSTQLGAARALKRFGQGDIKTTLNALLGEPKAPLAAQRGDVVLLDLDGQPALGIAYVQVFAVGHDGLVQMPAKAAKCCWRVG